MPGLFIIAHAPLASSLQAVAQHVFPECVQRLVVLDIAPDMDFELACAQAQSLLAQMDTSEVLVLTDVLGATPCNVARRLADGALRIEVVAGVNVPMLWRSLCYAEESLDALVARALEGAAQGVVLVDCAAPCALPSKPVC
jgi:mannose PTS system EIIA component